MLFEPGPGYLRALEGDFERRLLPLLRKTARGKRDYVFARVHNNDRDAVNGLAKRITELRLTLGENTNSCLALKYTMACLRISHGTPQNLDNLKEKGLLGEPTAAKLAKELLAEFDGAHV